jgi:hypothetical protein
MKVNDILLENEVNEAPAGMIRQGINKLTSFVPGSTGAKAQGTLDTGKVANKLYTDFFVYLGRTGNQATSDALRAFLSSKGIDDELINKHVPGGNAPQPSPTNTPPAPVAQQRKPVQRKPAPRVKPTVAPTVQPQARPAAKPPGVNPAKAKVPVR